MNLEFLFRWLLRRVTHYRRTSLNLGISGGGPTHTSLCDVSIIILEHPYFQYNRSGPKFTKEIKYNECRGLKTKVHPKNI